MSADEPNTLLGQSRQARKFTYCGEHDLPQPCLRCALLCPCGCDSLRDGVSEEVWEAMKVIEPFVGAHARRLENPS